MPVPSELYRYTPPAEPRANRRGLTLIEMMVAVSILIIVMLAVGLIFGSASKAVGTSQKLLDMISNVRAVQWQLDRDLAGLDKNGFLVIRCGSFQDVASVTHRCDLISFISSGSFQHRTGSTQSASSSSVFTENATVAPSAFITWGQLVMEKANPNPANSDYLGNNQTYWIPLTQPPTGTYRDATSSTGYSSAGMTLGRNAMLLAPQNTGTTNITPMGALSLAAYTNQTASGSSGSAIDYYSNELPTANTSFDSGAHITQSRIDLAATTPPDIMARIQQILGNNRNTGTPEAYFEAEHFCYRRGAVCSVYDGVASTNNYALLNGYFRMHPIALQGVTSFAIDWTDGSETLGSADVDLITGNTVTIDLIGTTKWYGIYDYQKGASSKGILFNTGPTTAVIDHGNTPIQIGALSQLANTTLGDKYVAIFSYDTPRTSWPTALRFRYHVDDPTGRLSGGRDFVQIVKLPD